MSWRSTRASGQASRRVAVADLGSNSWRIVIFSYGAGPWWKRTDELYETVRIGAGLAATGRLSDEAIDRGLETLGVFGRFARANGLSSEDVHVVATSAIRDASNGREFLERAQQESGLTIEILGATEEAFYGYVAAVNTSTLNDGAVLDIGGGSLQLTRVEGRHNTEMASFPLGAVRVTEQFLSDPGPAEAQAASTAARVRRRAAAVRDVGDAPAAAPAPVDRHRRRRAQPCRGRPGDDRLDRPRRPGLRAHPRDAARAGRDAGGAAGIRARRACRGSSPAAATSSSPRRSCSSGSSTVCGFAGIEATEAGLREGVFLGQVLLSPASPLIADVRDAAVRNLAIQYESDLRHVEHVARLSLQMFDSMTDAGLFSPRDGERQLLWAAAMLHDVGMTISYDDHHKHSRYLIESARAARVRSARACADRPDHPLSPQGGSEARGDRAARPTATTPTCSIAAR